MLRGVRVLATVVCPSQQRRGSAELIMDVSDYHRHKGRVEEQSCGEAVKCIARLLPNIIVLVHGLGKYWPLLL